MSRKTHNIKWVKNEKKIKEKKANDCNKGETKSEKIQNS